MNTLKEDKINKELKLLVAKSEANYVCWLNNLKNSDAYVEERLRLEAETMDNILRLFSVED